MKESPRHSIGKTYQTIIEHYEACLVQHGDSHSGVGWLKREPVDTRHAVMLDIVKNNPASTVSMLDFGCGASHFYEYILKRKLSNIRYSGLDISPLFCNLSRQKFPDITYYCLDILENADRLPEFEYVVMNGVFTVKARLSFDEMWRYCRNVLNVVFSKAKIGVAFNVMSKQVDWERDDLFHLPFDELASFLTADLSREFTIRHDYGLYEYTVYVYK